MYWLKSVCVRRCFWIGGMLLGMVVLPTAVLADAAPPWTAQGAVISPGEAPTQVQMVSEAVTLTIKPKELPPDSQHPLMAELVGAEVEAVFLMHNHGEEAEAFDVWFPLTTGDGYGGAYASKAQNFQAWVDGEPASVQEASGRDLLGFRAEVPWATWPVTFPPGQDILLRVTYTTSPVGWGPWGTFHYVLETGAGWRGPIGAGTVTFRLPYEVTPLNVQLGEIREAYTGPDRPFDVTVSGTDVTWHFTALDPRRSESILAFGLSPKMDNPALPMLDPAVWARIQAARADAEQSPDSVAAQMRLAEVLQEGIHRKHGIFATEANAAFVQEVDAAYERALELAPQDVELLIAYLEWLAVPREQADGTWVLGEHVDEVLARTLKVAPKHERVLQLQSWIEYEQAHINKTTPTPTDPTPTVQPSPTLMVGPSSTRTLDPQPAVTSTVTPAPTLTPVPSSPTPTQSDAAPRTGGVCFAFFALVGLSLIAGVTRRG